MSAEHASGCSDCPLAAPAPRRAARTVAVVGPPNCGKSTLFNRLTGLRQKVGNYPGVTVEKHIGRLAFPGAPDAILIDLPGVYSLTPRSEDERITNDVLHGTVEGIQRPDAILLVLDATSLSRHLVLAASVLALGIPTLVILNMADDLLHRGGSVDLEALARQLGAPVALASAARGEGLEPIREFLGGRLGIPAPVELPSVSDIPRCRQWARQISEDSSYSAPAPPLWTRRLDAMFLHPVAGPVIFLGVILGVFQTIFTAARPLMDGVAALVSISGRWLHAALPPSFLRDLLLEGVWSGVGSVVVFLPQILLLFLFLGILEDSGYLARAAVIADRTMARVGLQGKSFIPLLSAYACAVPAVLATRTIENRRDRIATILIAPFMTCSARLPIYTLVIAAFIPEQAILGPFLGTRAAALIGLYVLGFAAAFGTAILLKSSVLKSERNSFLLEMPVYRWPTVRGLSLRLLDRAKVFLRRAGTVILWVSVGLFLLAHVPTRGGSPVPIAQSVAGTVGRAVEPFIAPLGFDWKIGIGLVTSLAAREVIVATLGTLYGMENGAGGEGLQQAMRHALTPASAVALLVFFAFAMQCMSTVAVVRRETGGWKWPAIQFAYMGALAWGGAFVANRAVTWFLS
ncbi:MAG: ferrous iron transporter B [Thermoanaerobaculia bacterium]